MRTHIFIIAALMVCLSATAQRRGATNNKKARTEAPAEDPRIAQMLANVQQVTFIDSIVADASDFLRFIPLSPQCGTIAASGQHTHFTTEMGDHRLATVSTGDTTTTIATADLIEGAWTEPQPISGIGNAAAKNPFLMPDGITLYFAGKGERSLGGYDIFVTRYDMERGIFLRPENLGMPFASEADDIFYAIDEEQQLGYFVTDRRQPRGKVCIYTFIPSQLRHAYRTEAYDEQRLRALAAINSIADTWGDKQQVQQARERLRAAQAGAAQSTAEANNTADAHDSLRQKASSIKSELEKARRYYATASDEEKRQLATEILSQEQQLEGILLEIRKKERETAIQQ